MNKLILIGNLTRDPELKNVSGSDLVNGSIATTHKYKSNGETKEEVTFIDFVIWGKRAPIFAQYTGKGKKVALEGRLQSKSWESADGKKMSKLLMNVDNFEFLSPQTSEPITSPSGTVWGTSTPDPNQAEYGDDDIPF